LGFLLPHRFHFRFARGVFGHAAANLAGALFGFAGGGDDSLALGGVEGGKTVLGLGGGFPGGAQAEGA